VTLDLTLQGLVPEKARLELGSCGEWKEVPTEALAAGDLLLVLPGDKFPVDGVVLSGTSSCNEAALTGEPMPVPQGPGAPPSPRNPPSVF
jgi:P-type E1-E2 ATPase